MKTRKPKTISTHNKTLTYVILILTLGISLRIIGWQNFSFGFDQIQLLQGAEQILSKDIVLIGPRTGPANMFTGPLIYYLHAIVLLFYHHPYSIIITTIAISLMTGITLHLLLKRYLNNPSVHLFTLLLWATSPYLISLDRIPWNPNLSFLSAILVLLPLIGIVRDRRLSWTDAALIFIGSFLGYQSHFSGFIFLPLSIITPIIFRHKKAIRASAWIIAGTLASILPTIVFDIKHNFTNVQGLMSLIGSNSNQSTSFMERAFHHGYITIENLGKIIFLPLHHQIIMISGLILAAYFALLARKKALHNSTLAIMLVWIFIFPISFSFYSGNTPEYYYLMQLPALFLLLSHIASSHIFPKAILVLACLLTIYPIIQKNTKPNNLGIHNHQQISLFIHQYSQSHPIKKTEYHMNLGDTFGFKYLLEGKYSNENGETLAISHPPSEELKLAEFDNISINKIKSF